MSSRRRFRVVCVSAIVAALATGMSGADPASSIAVVQRVTQSPTPVGGEVGVYETVHEITVRNIGTDAGTYDLVDRLAYGAGMTIIAASVAGPVLATGWDGRSEPTLTSGLVIAPAATHTWTVTTRFTVPPEKVDDAAADCTLDAGESGTGTRNEVVVSFSGRASLSACTPIDALASADDASRSVSGMWLWRATSR
jgi:hypothetical protein